MKESTQFRQKVSVQEGCSKYIWDRTSDLSVLGVFCQRAKVLLLEEVEEEGEKKLGGLGVLSRVPQRLEAVVDSEQLVSYRT